VLQVLQRDGYFAAGFLISRSLLQSFAGKALLRAGDALKA
jgi:hypothetical protein